jgi:hypothetical protein
MPIALNCPCGRALNIKDEFAGRKIRCPACKSILAVPAAPKEMEPDDLVLEVLAADEPDEDRSQSRRLRPSAIQAEPPEVLPAGPRRPTEEGISPDRRRYDEEPPIKVRAKPRRHDVRRPPRVAFERGWFGSMNAGVAGGVLMILIAVIWFVAGLAGGIIFFYPPILLVIGLIAIGKGLMGGGD